MTLLVSFPVYAKTVKPQLLVQEGDWKAYVLIENGQKVCYMVSQPTKMEGKYSSRGDVYALVTHRPSENTRDVFSYITGYTYKGGSSVSLKIDSKAFKLFTQGDTAWAEDATTDRKIAASIRSGSKMTVEGTSSRGTLTTDTFSLKGSGVAYKAISKECGL
ncbi:MAG: hypothetical protein H6858_06625 [Rhodospirillales bacterium]|nr:hypothetical protein [Alphaproteobacteria bacterium]MCB1839268.1 hypothetical protein [Alphaproteobacteria bacterium]MCB9977253.1 hypothetical protein [Rhodospirillales bacterium]